MSVVLQDTRLDVTARLAAMNARHRAERSAYRMPDNLMVGVGLLTMIVAMIFVWAA